MNAEELHILQHSLGVNQYGQGTRYRNHYVVGPECDTFDICRAMTNKGWLTDHGAQPICGGMHCFTVTDQGIEEMLKASPTPPKLTRSQQRYQRFLEADSGMKFKDWLSRKAYQS